MYSIGFQAQANGATSSYACTEQKQDSKTNLICEVCGSDANGFNFNKITCESCKAFFRRNAEKRYDHNCKDQSNCIINKETRKRCRKCRIEKCFNIGMIAEWIMSAKECAERSLKTKLNKSLKILNMTVPNNDLSKLLFNTELIGKVRFIYNFCF